MSKKIMRPKNPISSSANLFDPEGKRRSGNVPHDCYACQSTWPYSQQKRLSDNLIMFLTIESISQGHTQFSDGDISF